MKVGKDKVVLMHYTLKNDKGDVIDSSDGGDPLPFFYLITNRINCRAC